MVRSTPANSETTSAAERVLRFIEEHNLTQRSVAREVGVSTTVISEILRLQYKGRTCDSHLVKLHNWLELAARRENLLRNKAFVETAVAKEILQIAGIVAETCKIGVVFGPAQIGKTFTLKAIEGDQRFGDPVLIRTDETRTCPFALCRALAERFELSAHGTFDCVFSRVVKRLGGTKVSVR